ncbi:FBD-associated F-box protein At5g18780 isoform X1 [Sorghum bicolor]|uniref:Uncharacterized protein n=1 Tax=Sorghum bicolor TaxID=4558 RepID=C5Z894_SORBI|nr:FBD-associated F-box protein At5g18780 isoform X1 [Sorghum bicolor]EER90251.1 hypothetical protein SORBI_3010G235500 [Sorghum bicolor]|eukprot:XP_002438884.1 FBD-associated F-box protein At5g18780 isoform X1 [Sorghum bicolor]
MAIGSDSGGGGGVKRQRVDDRCEAVASDAFPVDRISALPDELRLHVLTHLPLKDAIRTGALARGWRDLWRGRWAHRASLEVHLRSHDDLGRELDVLEREPRPRRRLERFSLVVDISNLKSSELRRFLDYAAECGVEDLHVEMLQGTIASRLNFHLPLSSPALACLSLRHICVSKMYHKGARPFHALEVIRLASVSFRREAFREMMALCPSLLVLDLRCCSCSGWVFDRLPPNLRSLTIAGCDRITSLDFVRVPSLRSFRYSGCFSNLPLSIPRDAVLSDLYIQLYDSVMMKEWHIDKLRKSLPKDLSRLNVLTISYKALTGASVLSVDGVSAQLPNFNLHGLKELHLLMLQTKAVNLANLYLFLKTFQCPNLERLFVQLPAYRLKPTEGSIDQVREEPPEDGLDNLVMIKVMNFNWCPTEVQLVSFLLRKASSLQKLLIVSRNVTPVDSPGASEADLSLLKEALVNGTIMFTESDNAATQPYHKAYINL